MGKKRSYQPAKPAVPRGRTSLHKTPLAVLRGRTGEHVSDFAKMIGASVNYLWKLESAQKPLNEELALRIQKQTAVSAAWLLGDVSAPPIDDMGDPYTRTTYERRRAALAGAGGSLPKQGSVPGLLGARVDAVLAGASRTHDERVFRYRFNNFLAQATADFGVDEQVERDGATAALALKSLRDIFLKQLDPETGKRGKAKYAVQGYQGCREEFRLMLEELRREAQAPLAYGMPASGPGILPILQIVAVLAGIEEPWWLRNDAPFDDAEE